MKDFIITWLLSCIYGLAVAVMFLFFGNSADHNIKKAIRRGRSKKDDNL
jgi:hypothetical protein